MSWVRCNLILTFLLMNTASLHAGAVDRFFFTSAGLRVHPTQSDISAAGVLFMEAKVKQLCTDGTQKICIHWNLVLDSPSHLATYSSRVQDALLTWTSDSDLHLAMDYAGTLAGNPTSTSQDAFGNPAIAGNFIISFSPPPDVQFSDGESSIIRHYVLPDLGSKTAEIKWAGIFFNPKYVPDKDYDLKTDLLFEIGRSLGLAPSGVTNSVMYPNKIPNTPRTALSFDDMFWAGAQYGTNAFTQKMGTLSGSVLNGKDGSPWIGAHVQALPVASAQTFSQNLDRKLLITGTFSREDGKFLFRAIPPGDYLLIDESDTNMPAPLSSLDAWLKKFSPTDPFESEFYDGAGRESNQEAIFSFSPQEVFYAATLTVDAGKETTDVTFITNVADTTIPLITAKGASLETLSKNVPPAQLSPSPVPAVNQSGSTDSGGGGCELTTEKQFGGFVSLLGLTFVLFLLALIRWDLKAKSCLAESRKPERYSR
ncbi:MAG: hypothetical protein JWQ35_2193 [Bacteriovoracaceae bacterium]|nr:hypothetical protein [Bacteriovoracaceae bacterium]